MSIRDSMEIQKLEYPKHISSKYDHKNEKIIKEKIRDEIFEDMLKQDYYAYGSSISEMMRKITFGNEQICDDIDFYSCFSFDEDVSLECGMTQLHYLSLYDKKEKLEDVNISLSEKIYIYDNSFYNESLKKILLRKNIIEKYGSGDIQKTVDFFESLRLKYKDSTKFIDKQIEFAQGKWLDNYKETLDLIIERNYNNLVNCGGYALEFGGCIFPETESMEESVSAILDAYPFVRLLGDSELKEDEYLVFYRNNSKIGHHFARVESNGNITDKWDMHDVENFHGWDNLEDCQEAVFAVNKNYDRSNFYRKDLNLSKMNSKTFEKMAEDTIKSDKNSFEYRERKYLLKNLNLSEYIIYCDEGVVGEVLIDNDYYFTDVYQEKQNLVFRNQPTIPFEIKDGKVVNSSLTLEKIDKKDEYRKFETYQEKE